MIYKEVLQERATNDGTGSTPNVRRQTQTQLNVSVSDMSEEERLKTIVPSDPTITPYMVTFAQDLVSGDLQEELFG